MISFINNVPACKKLTLYLQLLLILKFKNPAFWLAEIIFVFKHVHTKLPDQMVALIDMKFHEQNHFTSLLVF